MNNYEDLTGMRFGLLTVKSFHARHKVNGKKKTLWQCECDCGGSKISDSRSLKRGTTRSCRCIWKKYDSSPKGTPEYEAWKSMKRRCSPKANHPTVRDNYYGRGIKVCEDWLGCDGFSKFLDHVGKRPSDKHSLDRINNDGNYEPGNVRWATHDVQVKNRRKRLRIDQWTTEELMIELIKRGVFKSNG